MQIAGSDFPECTEAQLQAVAVFNGKGLKNG
jgi:hypothetical protein